MAAATSTLWRVAMCGGGVLFDGERALCMGTSARPPWRWYGVPRAIVVDHLGGAA
jgi:hypothetical protein